jgi:hypothetical protein
LAVLDEIGHTLRGCSDNWRTGCERLKDRYWHIVEARGIDKNVCLLVAGVNRGVWHGTFKVNAGQG